MRHLLILNERDLLHPNAGGAEVNLFEVTRRLVARGYRATLLCESFAGGRREEVRDGIEIHRLGRRLAYYAQIPGAVRRHAGSDTVIIEHLCKVPFCTPLYTRRPIVAVTHHLFGRTTFRQAPAPIAAAVLAAELLIPPVYRRCPFIAVSPSTRDDLIRRGVRPAQIRVIPNGVDCEHYQPPPSENLGPPTLLAFGRIEPYKRFDLVLQIFARVRRELPDATLVLVGGGGGLEAVRAEIRRLNLGGAVTSTGPVDEGDKIRHIQNAQLVLNTSEKEGWGLTVLEAAACGRPTIASDVPGLRDAVLHERTGLLLPHGDVDAFTRATVALLRDRSRRQALGTAARQWAMRFSWDGVAEATAHCIEEVCGAAADTPPVRWFADDATPGIARSSVP
jgi:glycosyltransferase involved in cell wall biosynthesis